MSFPHRLSLLAACIGAFALATPAAAQLTYDSRAEYSPKGGVPVLLSDTDSGPPPAVIVSQIQVPSSDGQAVSAFGPATARAAVAFGFAAVAVDGFFFNPSVNPTGQLLGETLTSETVTNTTPIDQKYSFNFLVKAPFLRLADFAGAGPGTVNAPEAGYEVEFLLDGQVVFSSSALLRGGQLGTTLTETGTDLGGNTYMPGDQTVTFDDYTSTIQLGTFAPGQTFVFETRYTAVVSAASFELGGIASIGDPNDLAGGGSGGGIEVTPVPEPGTWAMMLLGLAAVGRMRWRSLAAEQGASLTP
jgi:hypothetical protein